MKSVFVCTTRSTLVTVTCGSSTEEVLIRVIVDTRDTKTVLSCVLAGSGTSRKLRRVVVAKPSTETVLKSVVVLGSSRGKVSVLTCRIVDAKGRNVTLHSGTGCK